MERLNIRHRHAIDFEERVTGVLCLCGLPALTWAKRPNGIIIGGCALHPEAVLVAAQFQAKRMAARNEANADKAKLFRARDLSGMGRLKENTRKSY